MSGILRLLLIATGCGLLVVGVRQLTADPIALARSAELRASLAALVGARRAETISEPLRWPLVLCDGQTLVRSQARGYGGPIALLVAVDADHRIAGLRVERHQETPGIGDFIAEDTGTPWLARYLGSSSDSLAARPFQLDAVAGATITVRGIRNALSRALERDVTIDPTPCAAAASSKQTGAGR